MELNSWADLKAFVNQLNEEQLSKPVVWAGDEEGGTLGSVETLEEDYINPTGDGYEPKSVYKDEPEYEEEFKDYPTNWTKGTPILWQKY